MIYDLQKASLTKRLSAFLFDFIIMAMLVIGCALVIVRIVDYDSYLLKLENRVTSIQDSHGINELEEKYKNSEDVRVVFSEYQYMLEEERAALPEDAKAAFDACIEEMRNDTEMAKINAMIMNLSLLIPSFSFLISYLILEFAIPMFLQNGQTLGKKIFALGVMRTDCVKISPMILFVRTVLGKYTIGTMVPILMLLSLLFGVPPLMPMAVILLVLLLQVVLFITTKTNSFIHDSLASTVVVDFQSQMIFDSIEAKNEYILRLHAEDAEKAESN